MSSSRHEAPGAAHWMLTGLRVGLILAAVATIARWVTWCPYTSLMVPYDYAVCAVAGGLLGTGAAIVARRIGVRAAVVAVAVPMLVACTWFWALALLDARVGRPFQLLTALLFLTALVACFVSFLRGRRARWPLEGFAGLLALGAAASLFASAAWRPLALLYPLSLVIALAPGLPAARGATAAVRWAPLVLSLLLSAGAGLSVYPFSVENIETPEVGDVVEGRSVILIVLDTLRSDHVSLYGYERETTPHLDRWAEDARVFRDVTATTSWTLPSHASMFTGLHSRSHGVRGFHGTLDVGNVYPLARDVVTLAEVGRAAGVTTGAIVSNVFIMPSFGFARGFETYAKLMTRYGVRLGPADWLARRFSPWSSASRLWPYYRCDVVTDLAIDWMQSARGAPFFLFVNYMDTHTPNARPPNAVVPFEDEAPIPHDFWIQYPDHTELAQPAILRKLTNDYDRELMHLDESLGRLFSYLEQSGLSKTTSVIVTSDHGEYLGEHQLVQHSRELYEAALQVPLIVKGPGVGPGNVETPVSLVDVFPTVLELLDLTYDGKIDGRTLLDPVPRPIVSEWYASYTNKDYAPHYGGKFDRDVRTYRVDGLKLMADSRGGFELYDLERDPHELNDLSTDDPRAVADLDARLQAWLDERPPPPVEHTDAPEVPNEEREKLKALGYAD